MLTRFAMLIKEVVPSLKTEIRDGKKGCARSENGRGGRFQSSVRELATQPPFVFGDCRGKKTRTGFSLRLQS